MGIPVLSAAELRAPALCVRLAADRHEPRMELSGVGRERGQQVAGGPHRMPECENLAAPPVILVHGVLLERGQVSGEAVEFIAVAPDRVK